MEPPSAPPSPCTRVCTLREDQVCVGCFRHVSEIVAWLSLTPAEQHGVIAAAARRRAAAGPAGA
ncbi:MAG: DUF1289 domain-containing protein [Steroidobacteraceae bacterium]